MIRKWYYLLPISVRRWLRLQHRFWGDWYKGRSRLFVSKVGKRISFPVQREVKQPVRQGATLEAKLHNIHIAITHLEGLVIPPGRILSFWHIVGNPGERQGYRRGRNIVDGRLIEDFGGGLCQLSSAMYELALRTGLEISERHGHSTNVYTPETSYTILGLDATLAYGYKDLRIRNINHFPLCFSFNLTETDIRVMLCAPEALPDLPLRVEHQVTDEGLLAGVFRIEKGKENLISKDMYLNWKEG